MSALRHRGIVEGYYGPPWSHEDRLFVIEQLGAFGMNRYVYAPKDDPLHRERWREPYSAEAMQAFEACIERGEAHGVEVGFAISPGLSIRYSNREERAALCEKLGRFRTLGARFFALALDDVPSELVHDEDRAAFDSLAAAQVVLAHELRDALGEDTTLWLVPTDYLGTSPTDYLVELGDSLALEIEVGWTGRTVISPTIEVDETRDRALLLRRPLLLWDNTPVADGPMRGMLHLGPFQGRDPGIAPHLSGVLLNPMQHARASLVTIATAARFLEDPAAYDAELAFIDVAARTGAGAAEAFTLFARAHRFSALAPDDRDRELEALHDALRDALAAGRDPAPILADVRRALEARAAVANALREGLDDRRLAAEIDPWIDSHARETRCMHAAIDCLDALATGATAKERVFGFFALESRLSREPVPSRASFGPRRVLYPQLASMRDDDMALAADPTLIRDACLADAFVELAERLALERLRRP